MSNAKKLYLQHNKHNSFRILLSLSGDSVLGMLAPHRCVSCERHGSLLCDQCIEMFVASPEPFCAGCRKLSPDFRVCASCRAWLPLQRIACCGVLRDMHKLLVEELKFASKRQAAEPIAQMCASLLPAEQDDTVLCSVPTAPARIRGRGFDHAMLIARHMSRRSGIKYVQLLGRHSNTRQVGSSRSERFEHAAREFRLLCKGTMPKHVILIDDVMTTGASLAGAARALKRAGVQTVSAVVFARKT